MHGVRVLDGPSAPGTTSIVAVRAASSAGNDARRRRATAPSTDSTAGARDGEHLPASAVEPARAACDPVVADVELDQPEGLRAPSSAARKAGTDPLPRSADTSPHRTHVAPRDDGGEAAGDGGAAELRWGVDPHGARRADGECLAQSRRRPPPARPTRR